MNTGSLFCRPDPGVVRFAVFSFVCAPKPWKGSNTFQADIPRFSRMYICLHPHSLIDDKKKIKMENVVELMYNISLFSDVVIPEYLSVEKTLQRPARKTSKAIIGRLFCCPSLNSC